LQCVIAKTLGQRFDRKPRDIQLFDQAVNCARLGFNRTWRDQTYCMQERPDSRVQTANCPFARNSLKTATASEFGLALAHAAIEIPATERTDSMYDTSLVRIHVT